ncbi:MAG: DUF4329 domain-containing protein [Fibrobacteraceae bacterium]|nr:DUF4329 domain-containing protein [Fibrobacteraceae bacterium]
MLVYGSLAYADGASGYTSGVKAAYDYRAFGERVDLVEPPNKVTETFTGKELDDETQLSNHGARLLDPMLGLWISVDPKKFFPSPYLYMGNGYNPIRFSDLNGQAPGDPFNSAEEAAQDFARLYNGLSIRTNKEFATIIYKKDGNFSYTQPNVGDQSSVSVNPGVNQAIRLNAQIVTSAHTHSSFDSEIGYGNIIPSVDDFISEFTQFENSEYGITTKGYTARKEDPYAPAFVVTPAGSLLEYGIEGTYQIPTIGIQRDPQTPSPYWSPESIGMPEEMYNYTAP